MITPKWLKSLLLPVYKHELYAQEFPKQHLSQVQLSPHYLYDQELAHFYGQEFLYHLQNLHVVIT